MGYAELLRDNPSLTQKEQVHVEDIQEQVHRAQAAINGMRKFARVDSDVENIPIPETKIL